MKKVILTFIATVLFLTISFAQELADKNTIIVSFRPGTTAERIQEIQLKYFNPEQIRTQIRVLPYTGIQIWTFNPGGNTIEISGNIGSNTEVSSDPNYLTQNEMLSNDPNGNCNAGLLPKCPEYLSNICAQSGKFKVLVAVADAGIAGTFTAATKTGTCPNTFTPSSIHTWFPGKIWKNDLETKTPCANKDMDGNYYKEDYAGWNWSDNKNNNIDDNDHGSHVSGIVAQLLDLASNTQVQIMNLKTQNSKGTGSLLSLVQAIDYAVGKKVNIMNLSLSYVGAKVNCDKNKSVIKAIIDSARTRGNMLFVVAAGNNNLDLDDPKCSTAAFPAYFKQCCPNMIVVGGSTCSGAKTCLSNYGNLSVDIAAPSDLVMSSVIKGCAYKSGTSMAAPFVTATAALIGSKQAIWDWQTVKKNILSTVSRPQNAIQPVCAKLITESVCPKQPVTQWQWNKESSTTGGILNIPAALACNIKRSKSDNLNANTLIINDLIAMPNPFTDLVQMKITSESETMAELWIYNAYGQIVLNQKMNCQLGENIFEWQAEDAQSGIYVAKVQLANQVLTRKILKQ
jgi:subtilisin family serine protease